MRKNLVATASPSVGASARRLLVLPGTPGRARKGLCITPADAAMLITTGDRVAVGGSGSLLQVPETTLSAIGRRFSETNLPRDLDVIHVMGLGDHEGRGVDHLARAGLARRFIGSHFVLSPMQQELIASNQVEAIGLPAGTVSLLYREIAAGRPGLLTDIGIGTYVDPRIGAGRMNEATAQGVGEIVELAGHEWIFYPTFNIDVALIRASAADEHGNLSMEDEAGFSDNLALAQAAHNTGGLVIAEVKRVVAAGEIPAAHVRVPGVLVDHVVVTDYPKQTPITIYDLSRTGTQRPTEQHVPAMVLDQRKVVARRAAMEIAHGDLVNLGVGIANGISYVALEEQVLDRITITVEQGLFGGLPGIGLDSGTAVNPSSIVDMSSQFDFYDGGGLDTAGLAFAQVDRHGNVNVARVGSKPIGPGGFIDISQKASTVLFCGTFRGGGLQTVVSDGQLKIAQEGRYAKFVADVDVVTFSAARAIEAGQRVLYITERALFQLTPDGIELIEVAPGIDLQRDVLDQLPFTPVQASKPRLMNPAIFAPEPFGLTLLPPRTRRKRRSRTY
jgi:propionate CoA-transferase